MPDQSTPGQVAHDAYNLAFLARHPGPWIWPWAALNPDVQACWEAAAQAVLAVARDTPPPTVLDLYEAMGEVRHGPQGTRPP